ncbi:hypothetical protein [Kribbella solani]|uniref:hypothetical protein n=1 Tax=Kribbella solani TaxID=236067 RepID=UPI0029B27D02|nr:hypothetical protein [Kribbella solani]MDX2969003.1 hypothetical protein [Kribbella solani]
MTIYSQHPNRGKVQILATYQGSAGVSSVTVTSVDSEAIAGPIVDALNRVSAYATGPLRARDRRDDRYRWYPTGHIEALARKEARAELRVGAHSLWYQHVILRLELALNDLDEAVAAAPPPVRTAIVAELEVEARNLRDGWAEFSEGVKPPAVDGRRLWDSDAALVAGQTALSEEDRDYLNEREEGVSTAKLRKAVADLQVLWDAFQRCTNDEAELRIQDFLIADAPFVDTLDNHFIEVVAPDPSGNFGQDGWSVEISRWVPDDDDDGGATSDSVLSCAPSTSPSVEKITELLDLSAGGAEQLEAWARTAVGEPLGGTGFIVTKRYDG